MPKPRKGRKVSLKELLEIPGQPVQSPWKKIEPLSEAIQMELPPNSYTPSNKSWKLPNKQLSKEYNELRKTQKYNEGKLKEWQNTVLQLKLNELFKLLQDYRTIIKSLLEQKNKLTIEVSKYAPTNRYRPPSIYHERSETIEKYLDLLSWDEKIDNSRNRPAFEASSQKLKDFKADAKRQLDDKYDKILALKEEINKMGKEAHEMFSINREFDCTSYLQINIPERNDFFS